MAVGPTTVYPLAVPVNLAEGTPKVYTVTNPGAGNDWTRTVPGEGAWLVQAFLATLTTSAAAGTRLPRIVYSDSRNDFFTVGWGGFSTNLALALSGGIGASPVSSITTTLGSDTIGLPPLILQPGWSIRVTTPGIDVADTWTNIAIHVFELPYGPTGYVRGPALIDVPTSTNGG